LSCLSRIVPVRRPGPRRCCAGGCELAPHQYVMCLRPGNVLWFSDFSDAACWTDSDELTAERRLDRSEYREPRCGRVAQHPKSMLQKAAPSKNAATFASPTIQPHLDISDITYNVEAFVAAFTKRVTISTRTCAATRAAIVGPGPRSSRPATAQTLACRHGGRPTGPGCGSSGTEVRRSNQRPSSTCRHLNPCAPLRNVPLPNKRSRPGFESSPCNLRRGLGLCAAVRVARRCVRVVATYDLRPHGQGTPLIVFR